MVTRKTSDGDKFAGVPLILLGTLFSAFGLAYLATYLVYGWPNTPIRCIAGIFVGAAIGPLGYRLASGTWFGSTQVAHRAAALGGVIFIALTFRLLMNASSAAIPQSGWLMCGLALTAVTTWYIRARARKPSRSHGTR